ncbi:MAG: translocation/assembly module TamB domain-containing protein [Deltaproteobacteria bacterium]|nr:translocation/assembly module TamB domain-containing protein [Deltaproteobacteria bacterium]
MPAPRLGRARRIARRLALLALGGAGGVVGLVLFGLGSGLLFLRSTAGNDWLREQALGAAAPAIPGGSLAIGALQTDLFTGLRLEELALRDREGRVLIGAREASVRYDLRGIADKHLVIEELRLVDPVVDLRVLPSGALDLVAALGLDGPAAPEEPAPPGALWIDVPADLELRAVAVEGLRLRYQDPSDPAAPVDIALGGLSLHGSARVAGQRADLRGLRLRLDEASGLGAALPLPVSLAGDLHYDAGDVQIGGLKLQARDSALQLSGGIQGVEGDDRVFALQLAAPRLAEADIDQLAAQDVLLGDLGLDLQLNGPLSALVATGAVQTPGGALAVEAGADLAAERPTWRLRATTGSLDVHQISALVPQPVHLNLGLEADGAGLGPLEEIDGRFQLQSKDQVVWGEPLHLLNLNGRIQGGIVQIDGLEAVHPAATIRATGTVEPLGERATLTRLQADVGDLRALSRFGVKDLRGALRFDGRASVRSWSKAGQAQVEGDVQLSAFGFADQVSLSSLTGPVEAQVALDSGAVKAAGQTALRGLKTPGAEVGQLALGWRAEVAGPVVSVETTVALDQLSVGDGAVRMERIDSRGQLLRAGVDRRGEPWALGQLHMSKLLLGTAGYPAEGGAIGFAFRDPKDGSDTKRLVIEFDLARRGEASLFGGKVQGDLLSGEWRIDDLVLAPTDEHPLKATAPVTFKLVEGGAKDVVLHIQSDVGSVDLEGSLVPDQRDGTDFEGQLRDVNLAWFAEVFKLFVAAPKDGPSPVEGLDGKASMDVRLKDEGGAMSGRLALALRGVSYPGYAQALEVDAEIHGPITQPALVARVGGPDGLLAAAEGGVPLQWVEGRPQLNCAEQVKFEALIAPGPLPRFRKVFPMVDAPDVDLSAAAKIDGPACDPDLGLVAAASLPAGKQGERLRLDLVIDREDGDLVLEGGVEESLQRRVQISGAAKTELNALMSGLFSGGPMPEMEPSSFIKDVSLSVVPLNVPIATLDPFVGVPRGVSGRIAGGLNIAGPPLRPVVQGGLLWVEGQVGKVGLDQATLLILPQEQGYQIDGLVGFSEGGSLSVQGAVPLVIDLDKGADQELGREGLALRLDGAGLPIAAAEGLVDGVGDTAGRLRLTGLIDGSLADPRPHLRLQLAEGALAAQATGVRYDGVTLDLGLEKDAVDIQEISVRSTPRQGLGNELRQGALKLSGRVALADWAPTQTDLKVDTDGFWLSATDDAELRVDSKITVKGDFPALAVKGKVEVVEGQITLDDDVFLESSDLALDPRVHVRREDELTEGGPRRSAVGGPSAWESFDIALKIDLHRGLRLIADIPTYADAGAAAAKLSTAAVDLELTSPELALGVKGGQPSLSGQVELPRGTVGIMGSTFDLTGGTLSFLGADYANPQLDIKAVRHTGAYGDVAAAITGSVDEMGIAFQSEDYPDQTDIISILLFGKPASELADSEGQAGAGMLASALAMAAGNSISGALGSNFLRQIEFDGEAVRVGLPLSDKTLLSLERHNTTDDEDNIFAVSLEWLITRRMYAEMVTGDKGQSSADVYMRWRF